MLSSQNKPLRSTVNSSRASSTSVKKDGFFMYAYKRMMEFLTNFWNRTRRFLWISSTGFILLVLPFAFAYISQFQKQVSKVMGAHEGRMA